MKKIILGLVMFSSVTSFATNSPKKCIDLAEKKALKTFKGRNVEGSECKKLTTRAGSTYHRCEVFGSNGDGAGDFEMLILLNENCTKVTFSKITGME